MAKIDFHKNPNFFVNKISQEDSKQGGSDRFKKTRSNLFGATGLNRTVVPLVLEIVLIPHRKLLP